MTFYTNMSWPEDPYGTGQLWRSAPQLAASFAALFVDDGNHAVPIAYAVVYLPLHRTKLVDVTGGPRFGFRAATAITEADIPALLKLLELDASRARRLARIVTGHQLADAFHTIVAVASDAGAYRGIRALAYAWMIGENGPGMANLAEATTSEGDVAEAAAVAGISPGSVQRAFEPQETLDLLLAKSHIPDTPGLSDEARAADGEVLRQTSQWFGACATESALITGLTALHRVGHYRWDSPLDIGEAMDANLGDCFPTQTFGATCTTLSQVQLSV
ncbi:hypothetical protein [Acrocarpospora sp. B8E8]|uniref:hypothetical protein n=1 Tax=Acrocarpospora sp. B8E8 TaxID=3153572 RepID=UPI00325E5129